MKWFNVLFKFWNDYKQKLITSNDKQFKDYIKKLNDEKEELKKLNKKYVEAINDRDLKLIKLLDKIEKLESKKFNIDKAKLSDYYKITKQKYVYKTKNDYLHKALNNFSKDTEYQQKYLELLYSLGLKTSYKNEDKLVFHTKLLIDKYVNDDDNYDTDQESFGRKEWWLTPQEAFDYYIDNEGDCDDKSALLWGAIISVLIHFGYSNYLWRLLRFDMSQPIGHAICIWLNRKGLWKRVESTYYPRSIMWTWNRNTDIFKGEYVKPMHIFNEEHEYELK